MDRDYVINIILRARDEIAGTVAKATAEISSMDKAASGSGLGKMNQDAERLANTIQNKSAKSIKWLRGEMDDLSHSSDDHTSALRKADDAYQRQAQVVAKLRMERDKLSHSRGADKIDFSSIDDQVFREKLKLYELRIEKLNSMGVDIDLDLHTKGFDEHALQVEIEKKALGKTLHVPIEADVGRFIAEMTAASAVKEHLGERPGGGGGGGFLSWFKELDKQASKNSHSIAAFDNSLRGVAVLAIVATAQQLLTVVTSLGGELIMLAGSATMAGSALGGALAAGAAQALPVVGLLVSSIARVAAVISAVKQAELMKQQESYSGEKEEGKLEGSEEGVVNATEAVAAARENLRQSEQNLTKARFDARRELQDLILTERQAELAAKGATLSQLESNLALRKAMSTGSITEFAQAQLNVEEARTSGMQARMNLSRAHQDVRFQERGSPFRPNTGVRDAEREVEQSRKSLVQAERSAEAAQRSLDEAATRGLASAGKLNYMLAQLDDSERRLYKDAKKLYSVYKEVTRPITDIIVNSFDYGVRKAMKVLRNPELNSAMENLAESMGSNFKRVIDLFSSPRMIHFFSVMAKDAAQNIGPITSALMSFARTWMHIAEAAAPVLHDIVIWIEEGAKAFEEWVGKGKGLRDFFREGEHMLEAWLGLTHAVIDLFLALVQGSAKQGTEQVEDLTDKINEAAQWLEDHQERVEEFFHDVGEVMSALGEVILALAAEILKAFSVEDTKALGDFIMRILIPALGQSIQLFGSIVSIIDRISKTPAGEFILQFGAMVLILKTVLSPISQSMLALVGSASKFANFMAAGVGYLMGIPKATMEAQGPIRALGSQLGITKPMTATGEFSTGTTPGSTRRSGVRGMIGRGVPSSLGQLGARAGAGLGIAGTGLAIGTMIGGPAGKAIDLASVGAGLGMFAGPEGAAVGAGIGLAAAAVMELMGSEKKLGPVQRHLNALTEAYPELLEKAEGAIQNLTDTEEGLREAKTKVRNTSETIHDLEQKINRMREDGAGPKKLQQAEEELTQARKEQNTALREKRRLEGATPAEREVVFASTTRALSNVDILKKAEEKHLARVERQGKEEGWSPELEKKFTAAQKQVNKFREESQKLSRTLHGLGPAGAKAAQEINHSWAKQEFGLHGKGLIDSINTARDRIQKLREQPKNAVTAQQINESQEQLKHYKRLYEKYFGSIKDYLKNQWRKEIAQILGSEFNLPKIRKALREGAGSESAEARNREMSRALGGPIGSGYGGGDRVNVLAEEGEHMITKEEVSRAGGHSAIFALRRFLKGGSQSKGPGYAQGGAIQGNSSGGTISLEGVLELIQNFGGQALSYWNGLWDAMQQRTDQGTKSIERDMGSMEKSLIQSSKRTNNQVVKAFNNLFSDVRGDINQLTHVVYQGLSYVAEVTEKALQGFGVKKINLSIPKPKGAGQGGGKGSESKAGGGFVGLQGERGGDVVNTWLGRGEAVLNWGHQKIVEPAMRWYYGSGLNEMFSRTSGEHASGGAGGFAKGRPGLSSAELFEGHPSNVASSLVKLIEIMKKRWPLLQVTSTTDHGYLTSSGNVSDHTTGHAVDLSSGDYGYMNKAAAWVKSSGLYKQIKQGIHNPNLAIEEGVIEDPPGIYAGQTWSEHLNHIHLAVNDALKGAFGGAGIGKLKKMTVKGTDGVMKAIAQSVMNKAVKAANKFISKESLGALGEHGDTSYVSGGNGAVAQQIMRALMAHGLSKKVAAGITGNALQESGWNPSSVGSGGGGLWGFTASPVSLADLQAYASAHKKPWTDVGLQVQFLLEHVDSSILRAMSAQPNAAAAATYFMDNWERPYVPTENQARREEGARMAMAGEYAKGGVIQQLLNGIGGSGSAVPIFAHIGEWILNARQQNKLANLLGVSVDKLKGMLGFAGGPTSFAGGGEKKGGEAKGGESKEPEIGIDQAERLTALPIPDLEHFASAIKHYLEGINKELKRGETGVDKKRKNLLQFMTKLFARLEAELTEFKEGWELVQRGLAIGFAKAGVRVSKTGKVLGAKLNPQQLLNLEIKNIYKELGYVLHEKGPIVASLKLAQKAFRKARKEGNLKAEEMAQKAIVNFRNALRENELAVAEAQKAILEKQQQRESENVSQITEHAEQQLGSSFGKDESFAAYAAEEESLNAALAKARKSRNTELVKQIEAEKQQIEVGRVEAINKQAEGGLNFRTSRASIASAMGLSQAAATWNSYTIDVFKQQSSELQGALNQARASGNAALAGQIEQELQQIEVSIAEATAAMFQASIDAIEKRFARANAYRGMSERISQARSVFGFAPQIAEQKQQFLYQERASETEQLGESQRLLSEAIGKGFGPDVTEPLEEKIWDLTAQLAENEAAIYSNTVAIRQAYIDQIQERSGFVGGVFKTLESIVTGLGSLTGVVNQAKIVELLEAQANQLGGAGWELRGQLGAFSNERMGGSLNWLLGLKGEELVAAIQSLDFRGIEEFLGPGSEAEKQFQALINAILENEVATIENTKQLEEAMKENQIQSFTSTAWQWFRKAIFTGMGGLMPAYAEGTPFYGAAEGGEVGADGPFNLHRGELIIPNNYSTILRSLARAGALAGTFSAGSIPGVPLGLHASAGAGGLSAMASHGMSSEIASLREELARRTQNIETNVYEAEPSDPTYLSNRLAFAVKNPST